LHTEREVEFVEVAGRSDVGCRCAFPEHLLDGVSGDEVDEQKNYAHHQPDDRQSVEDALEEEFQFLSPNRVVVLSGATLE
jgi:hypothetical protein